MSFSKSCLILSLLSIPSFAAEKNPYSKDKDRRIKALSDKDVEGYESGKGMGFAKAAELNGYPGPMHVLELSDKLALTPAQQTKTQSLFDSMKSRSATIGRMLVAKEAELEGLFAGGKIDEAKLTQVMRELGDLNGQYRLSHLQAHLEQKTILNAKQIQLYAELRGYTKDGAPEHQHNHKDHPH